MKKSPRNPFTGSSIPAILVTTCLLGSPAFAVDYYHLNTSAARSRLDTASDYSTTNGSTTPAAVATINNVNDNLFFYNSAVTGPVNREFVLGANGRSIGSLTFGSNAGTTQIDRDSASQGGGSNTVFRVGAGGITVDSDAGAVTFGSLASDRNQRVTVGVVADFNISNNSANDLTFNRDFDGRTAATTHVVTVGGSGNGNTIFKEIKLAVTGQDLAMTINKSSGSGVVRFDGVNTYIGATTVTAGKLVIGASGSLANTTTTIGVNGTLAGGGTIGGATTIHGTHSPGFSPGTQTFTNGLSYADTAALNWELTDNTTTGRGNNYDAVDVSVGSFALATGATINLSFGGGSVDFLNNFWGTDREWLVVALSGSATAADSNLFSIGTITGGANWDAGLGSFGILRKDGSTTADSVYLTWTPIPEPRAVLLGGIGLFVLLRRRRA